MSTVSNSSSASVRCSCNIDVVHLLFTNPLAIYPITLSRIAT